MEKRRRNASRWGSFFIGFILGVVISGLLAAGAIVTMLRNPQKILVKAVDLGIARAAQKTVESIPRAYVAERQEEITNTVRELTRAYHENRLDAEGVKAITGRFVDVVADQQVTSDEIEALINLVDDIIR